MAVSAQSSRFAAILTAIAERLRDSLELDSLRVRVVKSGGYDVPATGEAHYRVRPLRGVYFSEAGAGRYGMTATRTVAIDVWTRNSIDEYGADEIALTEEDNGHYDAEEAAADKLALWSPLSNAETPVPLTTEPLHPIAVERDADAPEPERSRGYLVSSLYFEVKYVAPFTI